MSLILGALLATAPLTDPGTSTPIVTLLGILTLGVMKGFSMWWDSKRDKKREKGSQQRHTLTGEKLGEIRKLVNGPLGAALAALATAQEQIARMTRNESDVLAAVNARKNSDEHNANQAAADLAKQHIEENKARIIAEFLADKTGSSHST